MHRSFCSVKGCYTFWVRGHRVPIDRIFSRRIYHGEKDRHGVIDIIWDKKLCYLPSLLSFVFTFLLHGGCVLLLGAGLTRCISHVYSKYVDRVVIWRRCDIARVPAELEVINFSFISATSEHEWASWIRGIDLPDTDECTLFRGCR